LKTWIRLDDNYPHVENSGLMKGYTKLFETILDSTIWLESKETRLVWITMLAMKSREHVVEASLPNLADRAKVTVEECAAALKILAMPDRWSRTKEFEGRRIKEVEGGWLILNGQRYRDRMSAEDRREYNRTWMANDRAKKRGAFKTRSQRANERQRQEDEFVKKSNNGEPAADPGQQGEDAVRGVDNEDRGPG
jgi:hypothetical protein